MKVTNAQELTARIKQLREAQAKFATYTQEQVDEIFRQAALAANHNRIMIAFLVFKAIKHLNIAVDVGFVVGTIAEITPIGSATFVIP